MTPLWDVRGESLGRSSGWKGADAFQLVARIDLFSRNRAPGVCSRSAAQFRGGTAESWRLVLTGGGVRTPGRQNNAVPSGLGDSARIGGETFGRSESPRPCVAHASRQPRILQTFQAPLSRHV